MTAKAYSYIRFSSPEQAKGDSYRRQRQMAVEYCEKHGLELATAKEYTFFDAGKSAQKAEHLAEGGQLKRFLECVKDGSIAKGSYLLVENLDRLSRQAVDVALMALLALLQSEIIVVTLSDGYMYKKGATAMDLMLSIMHMGRAYSESDIKSIRLGKAWDQKKKLARTQLKPLGKACPYWLELINKDEKDERYQPIPARLKIVKLIFKLSIGGHGQGTIARMLNEQKFPVFGTVNGEHARNKSGAWGNSSVNKILNNRALLGEYQPTKITGRIRGNDGEVVEGFFPAVIDEATFYQAQAVRTERRVSKTGNQSKRFNVCQGVLKCLLCGDAMHLVNKGRPPKGFTYVQCHSTRKGVCTNGYIRIERAELVIREVLSKVDSLSLVQASEGATVKELTTVNGKLETITQRLVDMGEIFSISPSGTVAKLLQNAENEKATLVIEQQRLKETLAVNQITSKDDFFEKLDLITFEGRHAANSLLKRLNVIVSAGCLEPKQQIYQIAVDGIGGEIFGINHTGDEYPITIPLQEVTLARMKIQGEKTLQAVEAMSNIQSALKDTIEKIMVDNDNFTSLLKRQ
jgi:DNA invertase Pin-like site-specific DNA recombinase